MSKLILLDVDGTLINYEAILPESAEKAVNLARAKGNLVYICTGCSKAEIAQRDFRTMQLDGMIGANGGYVESEGKVILHQSLSKAEVKHIVDWCNARHIGFYLEANSGMYINDYYLEDGPVAMGNASEPVKQAADYVTDDVDAEGLLHAFEHLGLV